jgi:hypothetical protein
MCYVELYIMYLNLKKKYQEDHFKAFLDLYACSNDHLLNGWWINPSTNIQYVIFYFKKAFNQGKWDD